MKGFQQAVLLQRLSLPDDRYFAVLSENELEIKGLQDEIRADAVRFNLAYQRSLIQTGQT